MNVDASLSFFRMPISRYAVAQQIEGSGYAEFAM
jgi:hypothetical protein